MSKDWDRKEDANDYDVGDFGYGYGSPDDDIELPEGYISESDIAHYRKRRCYGYAPEFKMLKYDPDQELQRFVRCEADFNNYMSLWKDHYREEEVSEYPPF